MFKNVITYFFDYSHSIRDGQLEIDVLKSKKEDPFDIQEWIEKTARDIEKLRDQGVTN